MPRERGYTARTHTFTRRVAESTSSRLNLASFFLWVGLGTQFVDHMGDRLSLREEGGPSDSRVCLRTNDHLPQQTRPARARPSVGSLRPAEKRHRVIPLSVCHRFIFSSLEKNACLTKGFCAILFFCIFSHWLTFKRVRRVTASCPLATKLHPTPYLLHPQLYTRIPQPYTLKSTPLTLNAQPYSS